MIPYDVNANCGGTKLHLNALTANLQIPTMHLMVSLRGKETNVRLRKMVRHTREKHQIPINIREFVYGGPNPDDFIHFRDIPNWNITFHIVNEITAKWS